MMAFIIFLAYVVITAIWVGMLIVLNHIAGDVFGWDGDDESTVLWLILIAVCWPVAAPVACAIIVWHWFFRGDMGGFR